LPSGSNSFRNTRKPSAPSPSVPDTQTRSPGRAPPRRSAAPGATVPRMVSENVAGPGVDTVSPPRAWTPKRSPSAAKPSAKAAIHPSGVPCGSATVRR
jgi:hypothetical protein